MRRAAASLLLRPVLVQGLKMVYMIIFCRIFETSIDFTSRKGGGEGGPECCTYFLLGQGRPSPLLQPGILQGPNYRT
jgi:hypothetical protein